MGIGYMVGSMGGRLVAGFTNDYLGYDFTFKLVSGLGLLAMAVIFINKSLDKRIYPKLYHLDPKEERRVS